MNLCFFSSLRFVCVQRLYFPEVTILLCLFHILYDQMITNTYNCDINVCQAISDPIIWYTQIISLGYTT